MKMTIRKLGALTLEWHLDSLPFFPSMTEIIFNLGTFFIISLNTAPKSCLMQTPGFPVTQSGFPTNLSRLRVTPLPSFS